MLGSHILPGVRTDASSCLHICSFLPAIKPPRLRRIPEAVVLGRPSSPSLHTPAAVVGDGRQSGCRYDTPIACAGCCGSKFGFLPIGVSGLSAIKHVALVKTPSVYSHVMIAKRLLLYRLLVLVLHSQTAGSRRVKVCAPLDRT